jgi:hypothetical protein
VVRPTRAVPLEQAACRIRAALPVRVEPRVQAA